jgi:AraC-like DNA-binding protein
MSLYLTPIVRAFGAARFSCNIAVSRRFTAAIIRRNGLIYDAQFLPGAAAPATGVMLAIGCGGRLEIGDQRDLLDAPYAVMFPHASYEGYPGRPPIHWANSGAPLLLALFHLRTPDVRAPTFDEAYRQVDLSDEAWAAAHRLFEADVSLSSSLPQFIQELERSGLVEFADTDGSESKESSLRMDRFWNAVSPQIEQLDLLGSLDRFSSSAGFSTRHLRRVILEVTQSFPVPFSSWREGSKRHRLRMAVLALSARGFTIRDAARAVGYGSEEAMARAFRDAGMLNPHRIREGLTVTRARLEP